MVSNTDNADLARRQHGAAYDFENWTANRENKINKQEVLDRLFYDASGEVLTPWRIYKESAHTGH